MHRHDHRIFCAHRVLLGLVAACIAGLLGVLAAPAGAAPATAPNPAVSPVSPAPSKALIPLGGKQYSSVAVLGGAIPGGGPLKASFGRDGRVAFDAGCNILMGSARVAGDRLTVSGQLAQTLMACPGPKRGADNWVRDLVSAPLTWRLVGPALFLSSPRQTVVLIETAR